MKIIRIVISRIQNYFINNKILFVLFLIGALCCSLTVIFFYGNELYFKFIETKNTDYMKSFTVSFQQPIKCGTLDYSENTFNNVINTDYSHKLTSQEYSYENDDATFTVQSKSEYNSILYGERGRIQFTDDEINNKEYVIIIPSIFKDKNVSESFKLNNKEYKIIGVNNFSDIFYIPPSVFEDEFFADTVTITLEKPLSKSECENYIKLLKNTYKNCLVTASPLTYYNKAEDAIGYQIVLLGICYIITMLSFWFIMKYMVDKNSRETIIYALVGASKKEIALILFLENAILSVSVAIVSVIIHVSLYNVVFSKINIAKGITYSCLDYLFICVVIVAFSSLAIIPFIKSYLKNTIIQNRSKYSVH